MKERKDILDAVNRRTYASAEVVNWYDELDFIYKPEVVILQKLTPLIKDKKLLDLGIGGGRTTRLLLKLSSDYTGIDYTPAAVKVVKSKYPGANVLCADARDLSAFEDADFEFVLFSLNGIDYVDHQDRLKVLSEIGRVLKPGGFFMFSTHNRDSRQFNKLPWQKGVHFSLNFLKSALYTLAFLPRHFRLKKHEIYTDEYAIINDNAHGFSLFTYYIGLERQRAQLETAGFVSVEAYDMDGKLVERDQNFPWTYYLTQKPLDSAFAADV